MIMILILLIITALVIRECLNNRPKHKPDYPKCWVCGEPIDQGFIEFHGEKIHYICKEQAKKYKI